MVPAHLTFGNFENSKVPEGSVLIFDINLIKVFENETLFFKEKNESSIVKYLTKNNLTAQKTQTGLHYIIEEEGQGLQANNMSEVIVSYLKSARIK